MKTVNPYLNFNGNCEEAFNFYKSVFGGEFTYIGRYSDMPAGSPVPESDKNKILHVSLPIGGDTILMGADTSETFGGKAVFGSHLSIYVGTGSKEEADQVFNGLSQGGTVHMPMSETFWGAYFGSFSDKFGVAWMVSYDLPQNA